MSDRALLTEASAALKAAIAAIGTLSSLTWQPIATAPKDGTWVIGAYFCRDNTTAPLRLHSVFKMRWVGKRKLWQDNECAVDIGFRATHWMTIYVPSNEVLYHG